MKRRSHGDGCCEVPSIRTVGIADCGCCCSPRQFTTAKERLASLNEYREQVELELEGVSEAIRELEARAK